MVCELWVKNVFIVFIKDTNFRVLFQPIEIWKDMFFALCMAESKSSYRVWNIEITWCLKNDEQSPFTFKGFNYWHNSRVNDSWTFEKSSGGWLIFHVEKTLHSLSWFKYPSCCSSNLWKEYIKAGDELNLK